MNTVTTREKINKKIAAKQQIGELEQLKQKAAFWDELMEFIEDKGLGYLMQSVEKEKNISLSKAKKLLR